MKEAAAGATSAFRPEIQALRAIAVLLVVVFHLWPSRLTGGYVGVDVFFVISGYLITSHLLREAERSGTIKLSEFYARRIRRLLPASLLVLAVTLVASLMWIPSPRWGQIFSETAASAAYVVNWVLAVNSVDYFGAASAASPVQHYWSLSVEEQFYFVWPLLLLLGILATHKASRALRGRVLLTIMSVVLVGCLAWSIVSTHEARTFAYFSTPAHGWEFAAGGLLALRGTGSHRVVDAFGSGKRYDGFRSIAGWAGFGLIGASAILLDGDSEFPGYVALVPTIGALAVMASGTPLAPWSTTRLVLLRPVQFLGDTSYSLYLWHWPLITLAPAVIGRGLGTVDRIVILVAAIALAGLTKRYLEDPVRTSSFWQRRRITYPLAAVASLAVVAGAFAPLVVLDARADEARRTVEAQVAAPESCFGAMAGLHSGRCPSSNTVDELLGPDFAESDDRTWGQDISDSALDLGEFCATVPETVVRECRVGSAAPSLVVALVGDSHAAQYRPALLELARRHDWQIVSYIKGACTPSLPTFRSSSPEENRAECQEWKKQMVPVVEASDADVIITTGATRSLGVEEPQEALSEIVGAFAETWRIWSASGKQVIAVGDNPRTGGVDIPQCIANARTLVDPCTRSRSIATPVDPVALAATADADVGYLDPSTLLCDSSRCHAVVGGVIVYHDAQHFSTTFSLSMVPLFDEAIATALARSTAG
jgi:peptidoglycan/LPS O-acetylase OafA/YrhL